MEESADTIYLVLPSASPLGQGDEISDQELEAVAGGAPPSSGMSGTGGAGWCC